MIATCSLTTPGNSACKELCCKGEYNTISACTDKIQITFAALLQGGHPLVGVFTRAEAMTHLCLWKL